MDTKEYLKLQGYSDEQIVEIMAQLDKEMQVVEEPAPVENFDINPLHAVGAGARRLGNLLNVPSSAAQSLLYTGSPEATADSKAVKNFVAQMSAMENPFAKEGLLEGVRALGGNIQKAGKAFDVAPPMGKELLPTPVIPNRGMIGRAGEAIKSLYQSAKNHPNLQKGMEIASDIFTDPSVLLGGEKTMLNPSNLVGAGVEQAGKFSHSVPFMLLGLDKGMKYKGYNPVSALAYEKNIGGTLGGMTAKLDKYEKRATELTKKMVADLSEAGANVDMDDIRTLAIQNGRKAYEEAGLPIPDDMNSFVDKVVFWTRDAGKEADMAELLKDTAEQGRKLSLVENADDLNDATMASNNELFQRFMNINQKGLGLKEANKRKSLLNKRMKSTKFNELAQGAKGSAEYEAMETVRDILQKKESEAAKAFDPVAGAILEKENKNLSTAIEGYRKMASKDSRERSYTDLLTGALNWSLTQPPIMYKRARYSPIGGAVDVGTRKGIFNILQNLDEEKK
jgi:hypothetical protein